MSEYLETAVIVLSKTNLRQTGRRSGPAGLAAMLLLAWLMPAVSAADKSIKDEPGWLKKMALDPFQKGAWRFLDDDLGALIDGGDEAYRKKNYPLAAKYYLVYLHRNGRDSRVIYNLACCYSQLGEGETAAELLSRAVRAGFWNPQLVRTDPDLNPVRDHRQVKEFLKNMEARSVDFGQVMIVAGPRANRCRFRLPEDVPPGQACPLVMGLHGNGGNAEEMMQCLTAESFPGMICAAPEAAYPRADLSYMAGRFFSWFPSGLDRSLWPVADPPTSAYILNAVEAVTKKHPVSKVILLGFSQGVSAAWLTALKNPGRIDGVAAFAGFLPEDQLTAAEIESGKNLRVFIAHGRSDIQVDLKLSQKARDFLKQAGYDVQYQEFDGGHSLPPEMTKRTAEWIRSRWPERP